MYLVQGLCELLLQGLIAFLQQVVPLQKRLAYPSCQLQVSVPLPSVKTQQVASNQPMTLMMMKKKRVCVYLSQKLRDHVHVIVSLGHLLHTVSTEDWPEKKDLQEAQNWAHIMCMQ